MELRRAAALATGCEVKIVLEEGSTFDLRQNAALGKIPALLFTVSLDFGILQVERLRILC